MLLMDIRISKHVGLNRPKGPLGGSCCPLTSRKLAESAKDPNSALLDQKTAGVGAVTALEPRIRIASQSVFYAMCIRDGACASGCGVSQTHVAEIVFGIEIVEWDLCSACLSRTGFLEYFNSLSSASPREAEEIGKLLGNFD